MEIAHFRKFTSLGRTTVKQPTTHEQPVPQHSDGSAAKKQEAQAIQFLNQHRNAMIAGVVVAFAIVMGLVFYLNQQSRREREATLELFNGETVEDFTAEIGRAHV